MQVFLQSYLITAVFLQESDLFLTVNSQTLAWSLTWRILTYSTSILHLCLTAKAGSWSTIMHATGLSNPYQHFQLVKGL